MDDENGEDLTTQEPPAKRQRLEIEDGNAVTEETGVADLRRTNTDLESSKSNNSGKELLLGKEIVEENETEDMVVVEDVNQKKPYINWRKESDVGITEYISKDCRGIGGILKERYSDFIVHELSQTGELIELTSQSLEDVPKRTTKADSASQDLGDDEMVVGLVGEECLKELEALLESGDKSIMVEIPSSDDKMLRTKTHAMIKRKFPGLESTTVAKDDGKRVLNVTVKRNVTGQNRNRDSWPKNLGPYCSVRMFKENIDTIQAVSLITKLLHVNPKAVSYAGTKDKRGVTTQEIRFHKIAAERIKGLNKVLKQIKLGNFSYKDEPLKLGQLTGNRFSVVVRDIRVKNDADIDTCLSSLEEKGFVNYFGMQRFGISVVPTYEIGRAMLKCEWKGAVDLLLMPQTGSEDPWRQTWAETGDPKKTLDEITNWKGPESHLLKGLMKNGAKSYCNALYFIPRNVRLMYLHSYQSYVWNSVVSERLRKYGLQPILGDLVEVKGSSEESVMTPLTAETLSSAGIEDVVYPLPGFDVRYPENDLRDLYEDLLRRDGLDIGNMTHKIKDYSLSGTYRKIVAKPRDLSHSLHRYDDVKVPLVETDWDRIQGTGVCPKGEGEGGKFRALKLDFSLPSSCYATMALREVMKDSTQQ